MYDICRVVLRPWITYAVGVKEALAEGRDTVNLIIDVEKEGAVTAGDIQLVNGISVVNPEHIICNLNKKQRFFAELEVRVGRGYCPGEENKKEIEELKRTRFHS